ncbi:MAG: hypothetical protein BJ554DRAFT_3963, partial [Olpidium bornovanus]
GGREAEQEELGEGVLRSAKIGQKVVQNGWAVAELCESDAPILQGVADGGVAAAHAPARDEEAELAAQFRRPRPAPNRPRNGPAVVKGDGDPADGQIGAPEKFADRGARNFAGKRPIPRARGERPLITASSPALPAVARRGRAAGDTMPAEVVRTAGGRPSATPPPPAGAKSASSAAVPAVADRARRVLRVMFISLVLDLLAFTIILPLFPRLLEYYRQKEGGNQVLFEGAAKGSIFRSCCLLLFSQAVLGVQAETILLLLHIVCLNGVNKRIQTTFLGRSLHQLAVVEKLLHSAGANHPKLGTVLLGGVLGSLFSFLQFLSSPIIGRLSDSNGRRTILLAGNIVSALLWMYASSFVVFVLSRIVGGLSEGNVQLAIAIISDVTLAEERSKSL